MRKKFGDSPHVLFMGGKKPWRFLHEVGTSAQGGEHYGGQPGGKRWCFHHEAMRQEGSGSDGEGPAEGPAEGGGGGCPALKGEDGCEAPGGRVIRGRLNWGCGTVVGSLGHPHGRGGEGGSAWGDLRRTEHAHAFLGGIRHLNSHTHFCPILYCSFRSAKKKPSSSRI